MNGKTTLHAAVLALAAFASPGGLPALDCNGNGVEDAADLAAGASEDCNENGVPDECDVAALRMDFGEGPEFSTAPVPSWSPSDAALEDFDGDGSLDLIVAHTGESSSVPTSVTLVRNAGDGAFEPPELAIQAHWPRSLAPADLDDDGDVDLAVATFRGVALAVNEGDGSFAQVARIHAPQLAFDRVITADFDDDDLPDVAAVARYQDSLLVLLNKENLEFAETIHPTGVESRPGSVVAADIDGDRVLELLVSSETPREVIVFANDGRGQFGVTDRLFRRSFNHPVLSGDLDGDGDVDLLVWRMVAMNAGGGLFRPPRESGVEGRIHSLSDVDGDGDLDILAVTNGTVVVHSNDGAGTFTPVMVKPLAASPQVLVPGDLDGDGDADLVAVLLRRAAAVVLPRLVEDVPAHPDVDLNGVPDGCEPDCNRNGLPDAHELAQGLTEDCNRNGAPDSCDVLAVPAFASVERITVSGLSSTPVIADLDGDGDLDVAVEKSLGWFFPIRNGTAQAGSIVLLMNDGSGTLHFEDELLYDHFQPNAVAAGDFDGDGDVDLVVPSRPTDSLFVLLNEGDGTFPEPRELTVDVKIWGNRLLPEDLDRDGDLDLVIESTVNEFGSGEAAEVFIFTNMGDALFARSPESFPGLKHPSIADVDGDGDRDLLGTMIDPAGDRLVLISGFATSIDLGAGEALAAADLDADGDIDLVVERRRNELHEVLWNEGDATFTSEALPAHPPWNFGTVVDLDGDDDLEIVTWGPAGLGVFRHAAPGGYGPPVFVDPVGSRPKAADLDGDGLADLVARDSSLIAIALNRTGPAASRDLDRDGVPDACRPRPFHRGDVNDDARVDLADALAVLNHLFLGGEAPGCREAADANNDGRVDLTDAVRLLHFLFLAGPPPAPPGPPPSRCGEDTDAPGAPGFLGCERYDSC